MGGTTFIVEDNYSLDPEIAEELNYPEGFTIRSGEYPILPVEIDGETMYSTTFE